MKHIFFAAVVILAFQAIPVQLSAQKFTAGAGFSTRFDNREYSGLKNGRSETFFTSRLTPRAGIVWGERNTLMAGVDLFHDFSKRGPVISQTGLLLYYGFDGEHFNGYAGMFERDKMLGSYPRAFFSDSTMFYDNRIQGFLLQYESEKGYAEVALNWEGYYSEYEREKFRLLFSGEYEFSPCYAGGSCSIMHFANKSTFKSSNVVDNFLLDIYAGARFNAWLDFDIRLSWLQTVQRDRRLKRGWEFPKGAQLDIKLSKWGINIENEFYLGDNLWRFYDNYGSELYAGDIMYIAENGWFNCTTISYDRKFFKSTLHVQAGIRLPYDGRKMHTQQFIEVAVDIQKVFSGKSKNKTAAN